MAVLSGPPGAQSWGHCGITCTVPPTLLRTPHLTPFYLLHSSLVVTLRKCPLKWHKGAYCSYIYLVEQIKYESLNPHYSVCCSATRLCPPVANCRVIERARTSARFLSPQSPPFLFCVCNNGRSYFIFIIHLPVESNPFGVSFSLDAIWRWNLSQTEMIEGVTLTLLFYFVWRERRASTTSCLQCICLDTGGETDMPWRSTVLFIFYWSHHLSWVNILESTLFIPFFSWILFVHSQPCITEVKIFL